ncbi:LuxR C-terminal-related transcriptional regulator [Actinacidiphila glaucinigra]|uniref:helix-turn-helix transcriptional regulator n=1 Tax=Actinacidiphila glaucinigra TaxID=235986 RepID=UPI0029A7AD7F|nr:helix-turn-helix transcriptional regulator [Streptomyces sp. PA03-3a]
MSREAEAIYRTMLRKPYWAPGELAGKLRLDEADVGTACAELSAAGLARPSYDEPGLWTAVKPDLGVGALIASRQTKILKQQQKLERARSALADLMREHEVGRTHPEGGVIEYLRGLDSTRNRIEELSREVEAEVLALIPRAALSPESMEASRALDSEILARGVSVRTVYLDSVRNHPGTQQYAAWLAGLGGEVRTVPTMPMRIIVIDRKVATLPIDCEDSSSGALLLREPSLVTAVVELFERIWESAKPLGTSTARDEEGLTPQERELLRMLAMGLTDEVAGRHLGLSLRSVRRLMAGLMTRLDARSRFEAGVRAVERGWL